MREEELEEAKIGVRREKKMKSREREREMVVMFNFFLSG